MKLKPISHPRVDTILNSHSDLLFQLADAHRSVLHILFPEIFAENVQYFKSAIGQARIQGKIAFAAKANKGESFLEMAAKAKIGIDASSVYELRAALAHGVRGQDIGVSGPMKEERLLLLALQQGAILSVDDIEELESIHQIMENEGIPGAQIQIRLNNGTVRPSRFGTPEKSLPEIYSFLKDHPKITCRSFCFHLDGYSIEERVEAISKAIQEIQNARDQGIDCSEINIGGGFTVQYLDEKTWEVFRGSSEKPFFLGKKFQGYYPYSTSSPREKFLADLLAYPVGQTRKSISEALKDNNLTLAIEPGRALLDQAGMTLMRVKGVKHLPQGSVVMVDANINHLSEQWFNTQFLPDPVLLRRNPASADQPFSACIGGNTCMEIDMISWRDIDFPSMPQEGDLLCYLNTAGYQMDSNESEFHRIPLPPKVSFFQSSRGIQWKRDADFSILDLNR